MNDVHGAAVELTAAEAGRVSGGSEFGYLVGYLIGSAVRMIADADPFDGNFYDVGA